MHRLTAKFLLLFSLLGTFAPLALAATAPTPACCVRKNAPAHHCHEASTAEPDDSTISAFGACNHDCCRGAAASQSAHLRSARTTLALGKSTDRLSSSSSATPVAALAEFQSTRAPPSC